MALSQTQLDDLRSRSKDDRAIIVGSEVRELVDAVELAQLAAMALLVLPARVTELAKNDDRRAVVVEVFDARSLTREMPRLALQLEPPDYKALGQASLEDCELELVIRKAVRRG